MMYFGWRPIESCYGNTTPASAAMTGTTATTTAGSSTGGSTNAGASGSTCATPIWWYVLMGLALVGGIASHGGK